MKKMVFVGSVAILLSAAVLAAVPQPCQMRGPFPIVSMTYFEDGSIDYDSIVKQVLWADSWGCRGIIFGQSNDAVDLLSDDEKIRGFDVCAAAAEGLTITVGLGVNGTNTTHMLDLANAAEKVAQAHSTTKVCLVSRPPDDAKTAEAVEAAWDALGAVARRPVIMQTHGAKGVAEPTVEAMVRLAKKYPLAFGYIKEESAGDNANVRMIAENAAKPAIKSVFAGWGGWQWLHQLRQCGSAGLITERVAYAPILGCIWRLHEAGEKGPRLAAAYAMYRLLIDQRNFPAGLRGYSLYLLQKEGLAKTLVSREYKNKKVTEGGTFGSAADGWKLGTVELTDRQKKELDLLLDDMFAFVREMSVFNASGRLLTLDQSFYVQGGCVCAPTKRW